MKNKKPIILIAIILPLLAVALFFGLCALEMSKAPDPYLTAKEYLNTLSSSSEPSLDKLLGYELSEDGSISFRKAVITGAADYLDPSKLSQGLHEQMVTQLEQMLDAAKYSSDIYDENCDFKPEVLDSAYETIMSKRLKEADKYSSSGELRLELAYDGNNWSVASASTPLDETGGETLDASLYTTATEGLTYINKHYCLAEDLKCAPAPNQSLFGSTEDPAVIVELLSSPTAQRLLNGQTTAWNSKLDFIPGRQMRYYLDETILVLQWQEVTAQAVGTYAEVVVADGSQIRRKMAGDKCFSYDWDYPSQLAAQANAVLATGGDLYNHGRACGIVVFERQIYRFEPDTCDTCFITANGDLLYAKAGQFSEQSQAEAFIRDNDIVNSLCFGPVMIENGEDVTPQSYAWGEINDTYARAALGMLGEHHYLTMNINCEFMGGGYYFLATLQQATDAMLAHGCISAYALDGGQTAATVMNNQLINVVQFNAEKLTSDILYFATALPE